MPLARTGNNSRGRAVRRSRAASQRLIANMALWLAAICAACAADSGAAPAAHFGAEGPELEGNGPTIDAGSAPPPAISSGAKPVARPTPTHDGGEPEGTAPMTPMRAGEGAQPRSSLVDPYAWKALGAKEDPFDDRPATVTCAEMGLTVRALSGELALDVETGDCPYVTAVQPNRRAIQTGETVHVRIWHFELTAPDPGEAHVAVMLDGVTVLESRIPIPQPGGLISEDVMMARDIPAGALVYFHLHNHGMNSWGLVEVSAGP